MFDYDFSKKKILITGGLGMIGSTIARKLVGEGANVTLLDAFLEPYGSNIFNIDGLEHSIKVIQCDIRDKVALTEQIKNKDIIFNLAGQVCHNDSLENPLLDADINYIGHFNVLECVRKYNPEAILVYSGSRLQFGKIEYNPVDELHPLRPETPYALNKTAAERLYLFYHAMYGIRCVNFRIANPYGPRSQMRHSKYSIINWFIRNACEGNPITIFGDGEQLRDYIYVDDLADAFILSSIKNNCFGECFNIGSGVGTTFKSMVNAVIEIVGKGRVEFVPWPNNYMNVETGDYITDISKIKSFIDWSPKTDLYSGISETNKYYNLYRHKYW